jgi:hypothetical protein
VYDFQKRKFTRFNTNIHCYPRRFDISGDGQYIVAVQPYGCAIYKRDTSTWILHKKLTTRHSFEYVFFTSNYIVNVSWNCYDVWSLGTYEHQHQPLPKAEHERLDENYYVCLLREGFLLFKKFDPGFTLKILVNSNTRNNFHQDVHVLLLVMVGVDVHMYPETIHHNNSKKHLQCNWK